MNFQRNFDEISHKFQITGAPAGTNLRGDDLEQVEATTGPHLLRWVDSEKLFDSTFTIFSSDVQLTSEDGEVGLAIR